MTILSFSVLLNLLLDNVPDPDGKKYSIVGLAQETGISINQIGHYKRGTHENPTLENIKAILAVFQMPLAYLDCTNKVDAMKMITTIHADKPIEQDPAPPQIRFRAPSSYMSDEALNQVAGILSWILEREEALKNGDEEPPLPDFSDQD
ncbi:MAG: helix-turn-helix transcriptional regulator [Phototrophicaceae bacterium]